MSIIERRFNARFCNSLDDERVIIIRSPLFERGEFGGQRLTVRGLGNGGPFKIEL